MSTLGTTPISEEILALPDGRQLAYVSSGNTKSHILVIFFHGMFSTGMGNHSHVLDNLDTHYLAPTLPGWGNTSSSPAGLTFPRSVIADTAALISHLYPEEGILERIYISGGSFGTVPAQIVYGAPYSLFPHGHKIHGLLILGAFSQFRLHKEYAKFLPWESYLGIGPPAYYLPYQLLPRLTALVIRNKLSSPETAEVFMRKLMFDKMDDEEKEAYRLWRERDPTSRGTAPGMLERQFGNMIYKSVSKSWAGYYDVVPAIHSDWLFDPREFPADHHAAARGNILVVSGSGDWRVPEGMSQWIVDNYPGARLRRTQGGHLSAVWEMDDIWVDFLKAELAE
jgi:hypothetical protein